MIHRIVAVTSLILLAGCTPVSDEEEGRARCGLLEGPECRQSVVGDLPPRWTEVGKLAERCAKPRSCGPIGFVDCGSATDGPAYYYERQTGKVIGYCGGYCMMNSEKCAKTCPPPAWTCKN
jgi:hypothetical protein